MNDIGIRLVQLSKKKDLSELSLSKIGKLLDEKNPVHSQNIKYHWIKQYKMGNMEYPYNKTKTEIKAINIFKRDLAKILDKFAQNLAKDIEKKIRNDLKNVL